MTEETMLSLREAAKLAGITHEALKRRADRGSLTTTMIEGRRLVAYGELERLGLLRDRELHDARAELALLRQRLAASPGARDGAARRPWWWVGTVVPVGAVIRAVADRGYARLEVGDGSLTAKVGVSQPREV